MLPKEMIYKLKREGNMDGYHELQNNVAWHKFRKHADDIEPTEQIVLEEIKEEK